MSVINSQPLIGASGNQGGAYNIERSLRFRSSASAYLNRTPASAGNRTKVTLSAWVKLGALGTNAWIANAGTPSNTYADGLRFTSDSKIRLILTLDSSGSPAYASVDTAAVFRDPSAWYHVVGVIDTTEATNTNRFKIYVNGVQQSVSGSYPAQNFNFLYFNTTNIQYIGAGISNTSLYDGYMAEMHFVDGQALTPSSFGETDTITGVWKPKRYTGTYGTNGFYLKFNNLTSTSTLGNDSSGNSNTWTVNNVSLTTGTTYDSMTDVPTLTSATAANYCTWNPLAKFSTLSVIDGNLKATYGGAGNVCTVGTIGVTSGKWYWEYTMTSLGAAPGIANAINESLFTTYLGGTANGWSYGSDGNKNNNGVGTAYGATYTNGDVIAVAFDADNGTLTFYKNNTSQGTAYSSLTSGPYFPATSVSSAANCSINFGQRPFAYTPPSGFVALNTFNLPTSTIVAGNKVFDINTFTGTGSAQTIVNAGGFRPDFVWQKARSEVANHRLADSVRGVDKVLYSSSTAAEATTDGVVDSFNSNGYTGGGGDVAGNGQTVVAWQWQAGQGSTSSNTSGSITSTVSANTSAGFSIVTFTAPTSGAFTVGHGLGVAPAFYIVKSRSNAYSWATYHQSIGNTGRLDLNSTSGTTTTSGSAWNNTSPTSSVFSMGTDWAGSGITYVAYCWSEIAGYSRFGSYTGNGSADGTFIYTGFRPKFILWKSTTAAYDWDVYDTSRNQFNAANSRLKPNSSDAEQTLSPPTVDILSNGFKLRESYNSSNASGVGYIYMAFAENPTKFALAR